MKIEIHWSSVNGHRDLSGGRVLKLRTRGRKLTRQGSEWAPAAPLGTPPSFHALKLGDLG